MKSIVVYFSQTGNTKKVAEAIRGAVERVAGHCDIVKLKEANVQRLADYDLIGLGCPVFLWAEPANVRIFIRTMSPLRGKHCFIFATHGGLPGNIFPNMARDLRRDGLKVIGGFNCDGTNMMPHFAFPNHNDGHPDEVDLKAAADFAEKMVELSQRISRGERVVMPTFPRMRRSKLEVPTGPVWEELPRRRALAPQSRLFRVNLTLDVSKCRYPKCHLCVDNCPMGAIDLSVNPIIFRKGCIGCTFCERICPTGAIEWDLAANSELWGPRRRARAERDFGCKFPEFYGRAKTELLANRSTLYRQLVDKLVFCNIGTPYGDPYNKRPRYIIRDRR